MQLWNSHKKRRLRNEKANKGFGYKLSYPKDKYTRTISSRYFKDGGECLIFRGENKNPRMLTPREVFRLQGFPEKFKIPVSNTQAYQQAGNAVPINVVERICYNVLKYLMVQAVGSAAPGRLLCPGGLRVPSVASECAVLNLGHS